MPHATTCPLVPCPHVPPPCPPHRWPPRYRWILAEGPDEARTGFDLELLKTISNNVMRSFDLHAVGRVHGVHTWHAW